MGGLWNILYDVLQNLTEKKAINEKKSTLWGKGPRGKVHLSENTKILQKIPIYYNLPAPYERITHPGERPVEGARRQKRET